ncbi:MAG: tyrosine-protein phosphatase, partial [Candidatus Obscuribacterales bacterium]|nr:tyrosine-protein phosphatase [Steroidobacteraceae bacterium]
DGRQVAWGKVFRTGVLTYLTAADHPQLRALGIRVICDLRRADERTREPTRWPDETARPLSWDDGAAPPTIRTLADKHPYTAAGMRAAMCDLYRALPVWMASRLRGMFECAATNDLPMIVHCAAGKDRTGIAIALLLAALGVPKDLIINDYLLTNHAGDFEKFIVSRSVSHQPLLELPTDIRAVLFTADADYLHAALEEIDNKHGGVTTFLRDIVGVGEHMQQQVHSRLLA